jgi:hypothetical protein
MKQTIVTLVLVLVVVAIVFTAMGWITFNRTPGRATIEIKTDQIERAGQDAARKGGEALESAGEGVKRMVDDRPANENIRYPTPVPTRP